jgi:hypothetical protein
VKLVAQLKSKTNEEIFAQPASSTISFLKSYGWSDRIIENFFKPFFGGVFLERELHTSSNFFSVCFQTICCIRRCITRCRYTGYTRTAGCSTTRKGDQEICQGKSNKGKCSAFN